MSGRTYDETHAAEAVYYFKFSMSGCVLCKATKTFDVSSFGLMLCYYNVC